MRRAGFVIALFTLVAHGHAATFDTKTASFAVTFHGETSAYRDSSAIVMPGAAVVFDAIGGPLGDYAMTTTAGIMVQQGVRRWRWTAAATWW